MATVSFVQAVLASVCTEQLRPTLPLVPPLTDQQQRGAFFGMSAARFYLLFYVGNPLTGEVMYKEACDATNDLLKMSDGQLTDWIRPSVQTDLGNQLVKLAVKKLPSEVYLNNTYEPDRWSFRIINMLSSVFNFTPQYVESAIPAGGVVQRDGAWNGLTGQLVRQEVNMTGSFLVSSSERLDTISFGETISYSQIGLLIEKPVAETRDDSLLAPFSNKVWLLILVSMIVMGPLIWGIIRFRVWLATSDSNLNRIIPLSSCVWFVYGALMKQGSVLSPITDSSRMLFATWWIFITVVTAFYTANLTAYMTFSALKIPINTLDDIAGNQKSWLAPPDDSIQMYIESSEVLMRMKRSGTGLFTTFDDPMSKIIKSVRHEGFVYIDEVSKLNALMMWDYYNSNRTCHVYVVPLKDEYIKYSFATTKRSTLNDVFNPFVHWLVMSGIASKWQRDAEVDAAPCAIPKGIQGTKLMNSELRMIYFILLTSYACGAALLVLELGWGRLKRCCCGGWAAESERNSLSVLQRVLRPDGPAGKVAWAAGSDAQTPTAGGSGQKPTTTYTYGMSMQPTAVSTWSKVTTSLKPLGEVKHPGEVPEGDENSTTVDISRAAKHEKGRADREVLQEMRRSIKYINNRPYMFVTTSSGVRPIPVTDDQNEVFERIFKELKERPGSSRLDEEFGDLYSSDIVSKE